MSEIIAKTFYDHNRCHFQSLDDFVTYVIKYGYFSDYMLKDMVKYNVTYRKFLRDNGYQALVERLKAESAYLAANPQEFKGLENWWSNGWAEAEINKYDIQCLGIEDTITLFGEEICGLEGILDIVQIDDEDEYHTTERTKDKTATNQPFVDKRKNTDSTLYAAELWERYPIFDSYDAMYDNRFFKCFYIRNEKIYDDFFDNFNYKRISSIDYLEIEKEDFPIVYYDGESPVMYLITPIDSQ